MQRRRFLQTTGALLPLLTGCHVAAGYDRSSHGSVRNIALAFPLQDARVFASIGFSGNIFATAGEEEAIARRIQKALGPGVDIFHEAFRTDLKAALSSRGISYVEVPAGQSGITTRPDYRNTGAPLAFESQPFFCFDRERDGIAPGAMHFGRLLSPDGITLFRINVSLGPSCLSSFRSIAPVPRRFKSFDEIVGFPQPVFSFLMTLSAPLARFAVTELIDRTHAQ